MKNKSLERTFYSVFFLASVFFALYILAEYSESHFAVVATGLILLIAGYLLVNSSEREKQREIESRQWETEQLIKGLDDLVYLEERICALLKQDANSPDWPEEMDAMLASEDMIEQDSVILQLQRILNAQEQAVENTKKAAETQINAAKTVAKYNRENARQLAMNEDENTERIIRCMKELFAEWKNEEDRKTFR